MILFCGAGVSFAAGLPNFRDLVDRTYEKLGATKKAGEREAYRSQTYDRVFELLERRIQSTQVRSAVREILTADSEAPLDAHKNILHLSQGSDGRHRLITTNFDDLFTRAASDHEVKLKHHIAPAVPVRSLEWDGLVHLHGTLSEDTSLILSSSDFGRAYLTEGWASRFLRELFREYAVLFVGYGINDPIVRYLTDALASQRKRGEALRKSWLLAGVRGGQRGEGDRRRWSELGVEPCFYNQRHRHTLLYRTLSQWAHLHRGGLTSRANWAASKLSKPPDSPLEDDARMVVWALSDDTGTAARVWLEAWQKRVDGTKLSDADTRNALRWLELFESSEELEPKRLLSLPTPGSKPDVNLVGLAQLPPGLPPSSRFLAQWLSMLVGADDFLEWLIKKRCLIHPYLAEQLREEVQRRTDIDPWRKRTLQLIASPSYQDAKRQAARLERWMESLPPIAMRMEIIRLLKVIPKFRLRVDTTARRSHKAGTLVRTDLEFAGDHIDVRLFLDALEREGDSAVLASHAATLTTLLEDATDLLDEFYPDECPYYMSWSALRSIAEREDERKSRVEWTMLIRLVGRSIGSLLRDRDEEARALLARWCSRRHPVFQRLVLHAAAEHPQLDSVQAVDLLLQDDRGPLWQRYLRPERERFLRLAGDRLSTGALRRLENAVLDGPPEDHVVSSPAHDVERSKKRSIWRLLSKLQQGGARLRTSSQECLASLEDRYGWRKSDDDRDEILVYSVEFDYEAPLRNLLSQDLQSLAEFLSSSQAPDPVDAWGDFVKQRPVRALLALRRCAQQDSWPADRWVEFLNRAAFLSEDEEQVWSRLTVLTWASLEEAPKNLHRRIVHSLAWNLRALAKSLPDRCTDRFFRAWDLTWEYAPLEPEGLLGQVSSFEQAINHPVGHLAEALVRSLIWQGVEKNTELPGEVSNRLQVILRTDSSEGGVHGHVILAFHLPYLFFVDPSWTASNLLPLFDWGNPHAHDAWTAFLHRPRLSPDLLHHLKSGLLQAISKRGDFDSGTSTVLVQLLADLGIEEPEWISLDQQRKIIHDLRPTELIDLGRYLGSFFQGDLVERAQRWREFVKPWFLAVWPKETRMRSPDESNVLSELLLETGGAFPEALVSVRLYLTRVFDSSIPYLLHNKRRELVTAYPEDVLSLLETLVPERRLPNQASSFFRLSEVLEHIGTVDPKLRDDYRYRRLRDFTLP